MQEGDGDLFPGRFVKETPGPTCWPIFIFVSEENKDDLLCRRFFFAVRARVADKLAVFFFCIIF